MSRPSWKNFALAALACLAAFETAVAADEHAGTVIVSRNQAEAVNAEQVRALQRKDLVLAGDLVRTGQDSRIGMRFVDGSIVSLDQDSQLQIREYSWKDPAGRPDAFVIRLVSGGFRNLTGAISKSNPNGYRVETPLASLSIRGTYYYAGVPRSQDSLSTYVWRGAVEVANELGSITVGPDYEFQGAVVKPGAAPQGTNDLDNLAAFGTDFARADAITPDPATDPDGSGTGGEQDPGFIERTVDLTEGIAVDALDGTGEALGGIGGGIGGALEGIELPPLSNP